MNPHETDWTERLYYLSAAAAQIIMLALVAEQMQLGLMARLRELWRQLQRWQRQNEFEAYYRLAWPAKRRNDAD